MTAEVPAPEPVASAAPEPVPWRPRHVLLGVAVAFVGSTLTSSVWAVVAGPSQGDLTLGSLVSGLVGLWIGFLGVPWWVSRKYGTGSIVRDFGVSFRLPGDALRGIPLGIFCQTVVVFLIYLPVQVLAPDLYDRISDPAEKVTGVAEGAGIGLLFLVIVLVGPFAEEIFFRGLALRAFAARWGARVGVLASAFLFGFIHFAPIQTPALIIFGVILAVFTQLTGRLGTAVLGHMAFNGVTFVTLVFLV